ncbi:MAG: winged helix-turn-helix domain-containing protein [Nitrososphaeraceae archaeon]
MLNRGLKITRKHTENKALILEAIRAYGTNSARGGATTLNVMYEVYISYDQARHYLIELLQGKMIEQDVGTKKYMVTEKGIHYLTAYYDLDDIVNS